MLQDIVAYDILQGSRNLFGNMAWLIVDVEAHRWYFKSVYSCDAKKNRRGELEMRDVDVSVQVLATF